MTETKPKIREFIEAREVDWLADYAAKSRDSRGRERPESSCPVRTTYQRDRDRILHSKAFRRLKHKTQMFIAPLGDHYRTRLTHSLEVSQIARTIARALRLNEDLTESIALGHDLGHPPFGHTGEQVLNALAQEGYHHQVQGLRIVRLLEPLNLSIEVLDGMEGLTSEKPQFLTLEAQLVDLADRITYLHHDVEDAKRAGLMEEKDLPLVIRELLGDSQRERLDFLVTDLIQNSRQWLEQGTNQVGLSTPVWDAMMTLRQWMFDHIYLAPQRLEQTENVRRMLTALYQYYEKHPEAMGEFYQKLEPHTQRKQIVIDYIAGMTDRFAIDAYQTYLLPNAYQRFQVHPQKTSKKLEGLPQ